MKFWKLKDGELAEMSASNKDGNTFYRAFGRWKNPSRSGQYVYVCICLLRMGLFYMTIVLDNFKLIIERIHHNYDSPIQIFFLQ